jgi:hypothetical protein
VAPSAPPHWRGPVSGTQIPPQPGAPVAGSHIPFGGSTHVCSLPQSASLRHPGGCGHEGYSAAQRPPSQNVFGHNATPSAQTLHGARSGGHSSSPVHSPPVAGWQVPGQSAPVSDVHKSLASSTHSNPGRQIVPAMPPHDVCSPQGSSSAVQAPFTHPTLAQCSEPSAQNLHGVSFAAQPASSTHSFGATGRQTPGQSVADPLAQSSSGPFMQA